MINLKKYQWVGLAIILVGVLSYVLFFREMVLLAYQNSLPQWGMDLIIRFYPRFIVEKHRFSVSFFLSKTDMVVTRCAVVGVIGLFWGNTIIERIFRPGQIPTTTYHVLRWIIYGMAPFYYWDWIMELEKLAIVKEFYKPVMLLSWIFPVFPSALVLYFFFGTMILSNVAILLNRWVSIAGFLFSLCFILMQGLFLSFYKLDHGFATYIYSLLIFPLMGYSRNKETGKLDDWPLKLIWTSITFSYFMSGMEKLSISGWHWLDPKTLQGYLALHHTALGDWVSQSELLCFFLAFGALVFQLGFVSVLFQRRMLWFFVPAGILFHTLNGFLFQISGWLSPWILVYAFFVNWEKVAEMLSQSGFLYNIKKTKNG